MTGHEAHAEPPQQDGEEDVRLDLPAELAPDLGCLSSRQESQVISSRSSW
ncbi:hypothetical protein [Sorangium sp. So ce1099]